MKKPCAQKTTSTTASSHEHITLEGHERKNSHDIMKKEEIIMKNANKLQPNVFNEKYEQSEAVMESNLILTNPESSMLNTSQAEESLTPTEAGKLVTDVASTLWTALEMSEKSALDLTTAVDQVERLSHSEQYKKSIDAIFSDQALSMEEKLRLKAEEDARQDVKDERATDRVIKIQSSQKNTIIETLKAYAGIIAWGVGGVSVLLLCGTTTGRTVLTKTVPWAIRKVPHLARQVAV